MKFGMIGYGKMGKIRHRVINGLAGHQVVKIFDPGLELVPDGVVQVTHLAEILNDKEIDLVFICAPNHLISKYVVEGLDSGKHVFSEKPPGVSVRQVLEMREAEKRNPGAKLMFGFNHRHHESIIRSKQLIDSGKYGKLLWLRGRYGKSVPPDFGSNWRSKKELAGGGIFLDQGIHMLDLFLMMCGDFEEAKAFVSNLYWHSDIEDNVFAIFRNKEGQVASLHSTMTQWRHLFSLEMFLERGYIVINGLLTSTGTYGEEQLTVAENRSVAPAATWSSEEKIVYKIDSSWETEVKMWLEAIKKNTKVPMGNSDDALKLMTLVEKVYAQK